MMRPLLYGIAAPLACGLFLLLFAGWMKAMVLLYSGLLAASGNEDLASLGAAIVGVCTPIGLAWGAIVDSGDEECGP